MFDNNLILGLTIYGGIIVTTFWISIIIWTYRDMRARSRDSLTRLLMSALVAILNIPGLLIYILLRPRETLSEAYERSLEEEALLQEIEEKPTCPGCGHNVQSDWQACPYCHTRLKKSCLNCAYLMDLSWDLCPHCATSQSQFKQRNGIREDTIYAGNQYQQTHDPMHGHVVSTSRHVEKVEPEPPPVISDKWLANTGHPAESANPRYTDEEYPS